MGELYAYLPHESRNTERLLPIPPKSIKHPDYGFSVGRGAWTFNTGRWTRVLEVVKVNTVGKEDGEWALYPDPYSRSYARPPGEIRVYIDGQLRIHATGLILRTRESPDARVQGLHLQTFFGGKSATSAHPSLY